MPSPNEEDLTESLEIERIIREAADKISEHTDSCIIFVTKRMDSGSQTTWAFHKRTGNHYASYGQVREWLVQEEGTQSRRYEPPDDSEND